LYLRYAGAYVVHKGAPAERILIIMEVRIITNIEQRKIKFDVSKKTTFLGNLSGSRIHLCRFLTLQPLNGFGFTSGDDKTLINRENLKKHSKKPGISISTPKA
jgi:hypothetical protein